MNCLKLSIILILVAGTSTSLMSQTILTSDEAVRLTLDNNYGIKVARNNVRVAENNTSKAANGYLPSLSVTSGINADLESANRKLDDDTEATISNVFSWGGSASLGLNYDLFDRTRSTTRGRLREVLDLSNLELRRTIELNLLQLYSAYYTIAELTADVDVLKETLEISKGRLERVQLQFEFGQGIRLDVLNAQVDVQRDSISVLNIETNLANARRNLQVIMGTTATEEFQVDTTVVYEDVLSLTNLLEQAKENNVDLLIARKNLEINAFDLKIINAGRFPTIGANASYDYRLSRTPEAFNLIGVDSWGPGAGLTLTWNVFDGGLRGIRRQNSQIANENQQILLQQLNQEIDRDLTNSWNSYQNALFVLEAEKNNLETNQLNFDRTQEQFTIGQVTSLEFRQAQSNLLNASVSFYAAKYDAKVIELELFQLSGELLNGLLAE